MLLIKNAARRAVHSLTSVILAFMIGGACWGYLHAQSTAQREQVDLLEISMKLDHAEIERLRNASDEHGRDIAAIHGMGAAAAGILLALQLVGAILGKRRD